MKHYDNVAEAFSRQAAKFDAAEEGNIILRIMREQVRQEALKLLPEAAHILELNAGTGLDATWFAHRGYRVVATDISPGMIAEIEAKVRQQNRQGRVQVQQSSFLELSQKVHGIFDLVFSNFGGLNCEKNLPEVIRQLTTLTRPGSYALLVVMPPVCPWELLSLLKGKRKHAFRRWQRGGVPAVVEGVHFQTYYYSRKAIRNMLPPQWKLEKTVGLGALLPQPHALKFPQRHPLLFWLLQQMDKRVRHFAPFNRWADHLVVVLKRTA